MSVWRFDIFHARRDAVSFRQPAPEHNQFARYEESAKNAFIVFGQPIGQVDVEIVGAFRRELGGQVR
jgi:hypothetical protein